MNLVQRILRNVFSNWLGYAINIIVAFFISPFVVHTLGNTGYGIWILVGSLTGYLGILDLGIRPAIVKFVSRYHALGDTRKMNEVINTTLVIFTGISMIVILATVILAYFSDKVFVIPEAYESQTKIVILLVGMNVALSFPFGVFNAVINALQRFDLNNFIQISVFLARSLFVVIFLKLGGGLIALGIIILGAGLAEFLFKARWCFKIFPQLRLNLRQANKATLKMIAGFSIYTFIIGIAMRLSFQTDSIVIGAFMSAGAITYYAIAGNLITYFTALVSNMSVTITPVASAFESKQDFRRLRELLRIGTKYCLLVILPIGYTFLILGENFISRWMGVEYGPTSSRVLSILTWSYFGYLSQFVANSIFYGLGKIKLLSLLAFGSALANIVLSVILVKPYGIYGVALGTAIPQIVYGSIIHPVYICKVLNVKFLSYLRTAYLPPLIASLSFLALIVICKNTFTIDTYMEFALVVGTALVIFAVCAYLIALEPKHRTAILEKCGIRVLPKNARH